MVIRTESRGWNDGSVVKGKGPELKAQHPRDSSLLSVTPRWTFSHNVLAVKTPVHITVVAGHGLHLLK